MKHCRIFIIIVLLLAGAIGCQQRMTVVKAKLVEQEKTAGQPTEFRTQADPPALRHYANGLALLAAGDSTGSARQFQLAVAEDSSFWSAHYLLGVLASPDYPDDCLGHYRTALRFAPSVDSVRSQIYVAMATCYEQQSALTYAEQNYRTALKLNPFSEPARTGLDRVLSQRRAGE